MRKQRYRSNADVSGGLSRNWRQGCFLTVLSVLFAGPVSAQFFHKISFEHATDCTTGITTGRARQLCVDLDSGALWRCEPSAGNCDTAGEWKAVGGTDTTCNDVGVVCLFAASVSEGGPATTATALAANGGNCSAGSYPLGVDEVGAVESCTDASIETDSIVATHTAISGAHHTATTDLLGPDGDKGDITVGGSGTTLAIDTGSVAVTDLADGTDGELITWSALGVAETVAVGTATHVLTSNGIGVAPTFQAAAGGGLSNIVEDTTPQLGGQLDVNTFSLGDGTLELLKFVETGSAVNEVTITNAATAGSPQVSATGDDANIDLDLSGKGTGDVKISGSQLLLDAGSAAAPALRFGDETNTGFYDGGADQIIFAHAGAVNIKFDSFTVFFGTSSGGSTGSWFLQGNETSSATNATMIPNRLTQAGIGGVSGNVSIIGNTNIEIARFNTLASAVNRVDVTPAITGVGPTIAAEGETNVNLKLAGKGTGLVVPTSNGGAAPPATCTPFTVYVDTDETDDTNCTTTNDNSLCICVATDTWVALENN